MSSNGLHQMNVMKDLPKYAVLAVVAGGIGLWGWRLIGTGGTNPSSPVALGSEQLSPQAAVGKVAFEAVCAACHGVGATGTDKGPPLVHDIYNPGHHPDDAFLAAVRYGALQHHWPFGNMPPQPNVSVDEVAAITRYVRELQLANGIVARQHTM